MEFEAYLVCGRLGSEVRRRFPFDSRSTVLAGGSVSRKAATFAPPLHGGKDDCLYSLFDWIRTDFLRRSKMVGISCRREHILQHGVTSDVSKSTHLFTSIEMT
jgi:hypothetical protein